MTRNALRLTLALALFSIAQPLVAQDAGTVQSWTASRAELERRLASLEALAGSTAYSERARARAASEVIGIRRRLSEGDFRVGDRLYVEVEATALMGPNAVPQPLADVRDTLTVLEGQRINIRTIGEISLAGVLRSEVQARVSAAVAEVLLNARATTRPLVRLAVLGAVARPGYYSVPMEYRLDDLLMLSGGPAPNSQAQRMRMLRGDTIVLSEDEVRGFIASGTVVGQIGLQEGDQLYVERGEQPIDRQETVRFAFLFLSPLISALVFRFVRQ